jgi:hypothetical protein
MFDSSNAAMRQWSAAALVLALLGTTGIARAQFDASRQATPARSALSSFVAANGRSITLVFTEAVPRLVVGQSFQMGVGQIGANGGVSPAPALTWRSSDPAIVSVSASGLIHGLRTGRAFVEATSGNASIRLRVTVVAASQSSEIASIEVAPGSDSLDLGSSRQYTATARTRDGAVVPGAKVVWQFSDTSIARVSADGLLLGLGVGSGQVVASVGSVKSPATVRIRRSPVVSVSASPQAIVLQPGESATLTLSGLRRDGSVVSPEELTVTAARGVVRGGQYTAPASPGPDSIAASADGVSDRILVTVAQTSRRIALRLVRFDGGSGDVLVSSGVPLAPGQLTVADLSKVRLLVRGAPVSAYIVPLKGRHVDGSLRSLLVQASVAIGATESVPAELQFGLAPTVAARAAQPTSGLPKAMALPDAEQLVASRIVGRTVSMDSTSQANLEQMFVPYADAQWAAEGANWASTNYYDRVLNHLAHFARGGSSKYMRRAFELAIDYREKYLVANAYNSSPWWSMLEGLAAHYWLTGDEGSRLAVLRTTDRLTYSYTPANTSRMDYEYLDGRTQARNLINNALSTVLEGGGSYPTNARDYVGAIISTTKADGSHVWTGYCGGQSNFMAALQNDALSKYVEWLGPDPRVLPIMKLSLDYMWQTQWNATKKGFKYLNVNCTSGTTEVAGDLTMLFASSYAWYGEQSGDVRYKAFAEDVYTGALAGAYLPGPKQFNQFFYNAHNFLAYRRR